MFILVSPSFESITLSCLFLSSPNYSRMISEEILQLPQRAHAIDFRCYADDTQLHILILTIGISLNLQPQTVEQPKVARFEIPVIF